MHYTNTRNFGNLEQDPQPPYCYFSPNNGKLYILKGEQNTAPLKSQKSKVNMTIL